MKCFAILLAEFFMHAYLRPMLILRCHSFGKCLFSSNAQGMTPIAKIAIAISISILIFEIAIAISIAISKKIADRDRRFAIIDHDRDQFTFKKSKSSIL